MDSSMLSCYNICEYEQEVMNFVSNELNSWQNMCIGKELMRTFSLLIKMFNFDTSTTVNTQNLLLLICGTKIYCEKWPFMTQIISKYHM